MFNDDRINQDQFIASVNANAYATKFIIYHMTMVLDEMSSEFNFSDKLKEEITKTLNKLDSMQQRDIKTAINGIMSYPLKPMFGGVLNSNKKEKPFIE
ncbi:hypothetical protein JYL57_001480 [Salmonella enterica subsp. enterica serovar Typhimurium]|uniref:hypothetical protein n=1 Tax=Salmonella enterica TaxID=28901 RepID=UPI00193DFBD4|nr:hypothetical protein [Salmonella enterica]EDY1994240.1 hypothetical protein [Salmonella enterica subsp. diarizonae]EEN5590426.1 hypothetical protein [Salmonella enterica subsp. enterica serovar Mountpleasant]EHD9479271.1 hypothetical protein [Salmonella enterica subsp. enterica serovar Typhimurium]